MLTSKNNSSVAVAVHVIKQITSNQEMSLFEMSSPYKEPLQKNSCECEKNLICQIHTYTIYLAYTIYIICQINKVQIKNYIKLYKLYKIIKLYTRIIKMMNEDIHHHL